jgi:Replication initiator protein, pSAM2
MVSPAATLTPGASAPGVGVSAGVMGDAVHVVEQLLGGQVLDEQGGDDLALPLRAAERVCQWAGCTRAPVSAARDRRGRVAVCADHWRQLAATSVDSRSTVLARAADPGYRQWADRAAAAGGCTSPVRLRPESACVDPATGELSPVAGTGGEDEVIYKACGNRRAAVCPSCAETYRADAYQLVLAGLRGGKGVPETVAGHPALFATLTGPSFGPVHSCHADPATGKVRPCRPDRRRPTCPHGRLLSCGRRHGEHDPRLGQPLCPDCYDYRGHAVWNAWARELWRRTTVGLSRAVTRHRPARAPAARVSFGKVAEFQRRGLVHYHVVLRLDGLDPADPAAVVAPPGWASIFVLAHALREAFAGTRFATPPHPVRPTGWVIGWGDPDAGGLDIRPLRFPGERAIDRSAVAGYLAKYATKSTEDTGHLSKRLRPDTVDHYTDDTHPGRLVDACWTLGTPEAGPEWERMRRWAHQLGYGGHFFTKSRRYTATFRVIRAARRAWVRRQADLDTEATNATEVVITSWSFVGIGWQTTGDALLAQTSAALARERRRIAREEAVSE